MRLLSAVVALLGASSSVDRGVLARDLKKYDPRIRQEEFLRKKREAASIAKRQAPTTTTPQFLNNITSPFAVNGSALPNVTFDIGESYAGLLPIDETSGKELFFWFVPTTNPKASDEITIWLNGGPGCSSFDGFFKENGPVVWPSGTLAPVKNPWAWSNLTNMVWVEQPVGTGFSTGTPNATSEADVAIQFKGFWKNFVDTFGLNGQKVYVTGESYAGMYVPYIADAMLQSNDSSYFDVNGILIYDPSIGDDQLTEQIPTLAFVEYHKNLFPFNDTFSKELHRISDSCGYTSYLEEHLQFPPKGPQPTQLPGYNANGTFRRECDIFDAVFDGISTINPCFNIYQVGQGCPILWDVLGFPYSDFYLPAGYPEPYFNHTDVKKAIHAPLDANWEICSDRNVFVSPGDRSDASGAPGGPLERVVERTKNVIVGHGTLDMVLILNGTLLTLQNLTWNGIQGFTEPPTKPFYVPYHHEASIETVSGAGIFGGWTTRDGLTFVSIELSGHMVPEYQPAAGYRHLELLLGRIQNLSEVSPFTTQPGFVQNQVPLGNNPSTPW